MTMKIPTGYRSHAEAAVYLEIQDRTLRALVKQGQIAQYRLAINRRWRLYLFEDLRALKKKITQGGKNGNVYCD